MPLFLFWFPFFCRDDDGDGWCLKIKKATAAPTIRVKKNETLNAAVVSGDSFGSPFEAHIK